MNGRTYNNESYRFGFNGKERDNETFTDAYDFGARILDTRLGRWLSRDPFESSYEEYSTYGYALNNPIVIIDKGGNYVDITLTYDKVTHQPIITINVCGSVVNNSKKELSDKDMMSYISNYSAELNRVLNNFEKVNTSGMKVIFNMNFKVAKTPEDIDPDDHVIHFMETDEYYELTDGTPGANVNRFGGKQTFIPLKTIGSAMSVAHELAHLLGLRHTFNIDLNEEDISAFTNYYIKKDGSISNMMHYKGGETMAPVQILMMYAFYVTGMLNQGLNSFEVDESNIVTNTKIITKNYLSDPKGFEIMENEIHKTSKNLSNESNHLKHGKPLRTLSDEFNENEIPTVLE